jgi:phosphoribosyl 1,2-cyclic phosphate phosphodiesterase
MEVIVLGSGTSTGIPIPACPCSVCLSTDSKNKRLRPSILIKSEATSIIVDTGPDFRAQVLRENVTKLDAVLFTHTHADHIFGLDDLRAFNFASKKPMDLYATKNDGLYIRKIFDYAFDPDPNYQGGGLPKLNLLEISPPDPIKVNELTIQPIPIKHGQTDVLGFRINDFAYLTDCSEILNESYGFLENLEVLIIDGLRERPHPTHFNFASAIKEIEKIKPKQTYFTHIGHEVDHPETNKLLATLSKERVELSYDGLKISL